MTSVMAEIHLIRNDEGELKGWVSHYIIIVLYLCLWVMPSLPGPPMKGQRPNSSAKSSLLMSASGLMLSVKKLLIWLDELPAALGKVRMNSIKVSGLCHLIKVETI